MMPIHHVPPPSSLARQLAAIRDAGCRLNVLPRNAEEAVARVRAAINPGERLRGIELVRRMGENGICSTSARTSMAVAHKYGVLSSQGEGTNRTYWLTDQGD